MPRAFLIAAGRLDDGQHRLLHQRRTDQHQPAGGHLHHQPQGGLERRHPDHVGGHRQPDPRHQRQGQEFRDRQHQRRERVESVTRGVDDRQAVMTFAKPYAEWRGMFAGNTMLLPKSMTATPGGVQQGSAEWARPVGRTVHRLRLDRTTQRIVLTRNPKWWGTAALLDSITYPGARRRRANPGAAEQHHRRDRAAHPRRADDRAAHQRGSRSGVRPEPSWYHFTFNGAPGSILADKALRLAIAKGIDRQTHRQRHPARARGQSRPP